MEKINIIEEKQNPLFGRKEVQVDLTSETPPTHEEAEKILADNFKTKEENIKIKKIANKFGSRTFVISANIYSSKEEKDNIEIKTKRDLEREKAIADDAAKKVEEANKAAEEEKKAKDEVKEEKPAEVVADESKPETNDTETKTE